MPYWLECSVSHITDPERIITDDRSYPATGLTVRGHWVGDTGLHSALHGYSCFTQLAEKTAERKEGIVETKDAVISFTLQLNFTVFSAVIQHYLTSSVLLRPFFMLILLKRNYGFISCLNICDTFRLNHGYSH